MSTLDLTSGALSRTEVRDLMLAWRKYVRANARANAAYWVQRDTVDARYSGRRRRQPPSPT